MTSSQLHQPLSLIDAGLLSRKLSLDRRIPNRYAFALEPQPLG